MDVGEIEPRAAAAAADPLVRVMAVLPEPGLDDGLVGVVHHRRRRGHGLTGVDHRVPRDEGGRGGTLLQVEAAARLPDQRVWRCSHTGGHRFAPTAITVADGRAWAWADADLLAAITRRAIPVDELVERDRGSVLLDPWVQPLERELFRRHGWPWLDGELLAASATVADDGRRATTEVTWRAVDGREHTATGDVEVTRDVPVLVCGEPPEAATKTSQELALRTVSIDGVGQSLQPVSR
jgi:hypothetical protein